MGKEAGWIVIGTEVKTDGIDKGIASIREKMDKLRKKAEQPYEINGAKIEGGWELSKEEQQSYDRLERSLAKLEAKKQEILGIEEEITEEIKEQNNISNAQTFGGNASKIAGLSGELERLVSEYRDITKAPIIDSNDIGQAKQLKKEILEIVKEYESLSGKKLTIKGITDVKNELPGIKGQIESIGSSIENVIRKVVGWGLAIFGIRSAYMFIRQEMGVLSQYNAKLGADMEYMRWSIATALAPVIEKIIQMAYKLLVYTAYILKAWTGIDLFANASASAFERAKKATGGTADNLKSAGKEARDLKKTLAGFDEMNILQKDGSTALGGGGGGIGASDFVAPSLDLGDWKYVEIPEWIKWIADNGKLIANILGAIGLAIASIKIGEFFGKLIQGTTGLTQFSGGIALVVGGLALLAGQIVNLILHYDTMNEKQRETAITLGTLGGAFTGLGVAMIAGASAMGIALGGLVGALVGLVAMVGVSIIKHEQERKAIHDVEKQEKSLKDAREAQRKTYDEYINAVDRETDAQRNLVKIQKETGISGAELYKQVQSGNLTYKQMNETQKKVYKAYLDSINATKDLSEIEKQLNKDNQEVLFSEFKKKIAADDTGKSFGKMKEEIVKAWQEGKLSTKQATNLIERLVADMSTKNTQKFYKDLPDAIKSGLDPNKYKSTWNKFKNWFTNAFADLKPAMKVGGTVYIQPGQKATFAKGGIIHHKLPKLAPGGIINMPGRGVPLGSAIGGERGAEGVIPLTDSQQMTLLGEAIGKYININATVPVYVGNRQIAKEIRKINAEDDFAYNR